MTGSRVHLLSRIATVMLTLSVGVDVDAQETSSPRHQAGLVGGVHFGAPAKASATLGVSRFSKRDVEEKRRSRTVTIKEERHLFVAAEAGLRAHRLSAGYGVKRGDRHSVTIVHGAIAALRMRQGSDTGATYIGLQAQAFGMADIALGLRLGVFVKAIGPATARRMLLAADFPIGW